MRTFLYASLAAWMLLCGVLFTLEEFKQDSIKASLAMLFCSFATGVFVKFTIDSERKP